MTELPRCYGCGTFSPSYSREITGFFLSMFKKCWCWKCWTESTVDQLKAKAKEV